jgi:hypothetical protein
LADGDVALVGWPAVDRTDWLMAPGRWARIFVVATAAVTAVMLVAPGMSVATSRSCRGFDLYGSHYNVTIHKGTVRCKQARNTLRSFLSGNGVEHGSGAEANKYWTLPHGWKCGHGAGGGACIRHGHSYQDAKAFIEAWWSP